MSNFVFWRAGSVLLANEWVVIEWSKVLYKASRNSINVFGKLAKFMLRSGCDGELRRQRYWFDSPEGSSVFSLLSQN